MATPEGTLTQSSQGTVAEAMRGAKTAAARAGAAAETAELPEIYRSLDIEFWSGMSVDQREALRHMQMAYADNAVLRAEKVQASEAVKDGDDALLALATPRLIAGGFMMGAGFLATILSLFDLVPPSMLWIALPIALFGLVLTIDRRN